MDGTSGLQTMKTFRLAGQLEATSPEKTLDRLALLVQQRRLLFFFGAGLSRAFPSLNPLVDQTRGLPGLRSLLVEIIRAGCPSFSHESVTASLYGSPLEVILEQLALVVGDRAFDFLDILGTAPNGLAGGPNYNHYALALLAKAGLCRNFLTVNFDTLFEEAYSAIGGGNLIVPEEHPYEKRLYACAVAGKLASAVCLFKLHGTLHAKRHLLTTMDVVGLGLPPHKERLLRELLPAYACFFMGYRSGDRDIFPVLSSLSSVCEVFWFDVGIRPEDLTPLSALLLPRPHHLIINSELPPVLQSLLARVGIDESAALERLGIESLSEFAVREDAAVQAKEQQLRAFAERFREKFLPPEAARLMMSLALALGNGGAEMRERLFRSVQEEHLPQELRYAYSGQVAERQWGEGRFGDAISTRLMALRHLRESALPPSGKRREAIEQHIRMGRDYLALSRRDLSSRSFQRLWCQVNAVVQFVTATAQLVAFGYQLTSLECGRLWLMLFLRVPTALHKRLERRLLHELRRWVRRPRKAFTMLRSPAARVELAAVEWMYRLCLRLPASTYGWKSLGMRSLAELLMHRTGRCPPEAVRLISEARTVRGQFDELGTHEALALLYSGAFEAAAEILDATFRYYQDESRGYFGGMSKTLEMKALCFALQGRSADAAAALAAYDALQRTTRSAE